MVRIDRYMLSQLLVLFGFFALVLVAVLWINRGVSLFEQLISDGQSALVFMEFTALGLPKPAGMPPSQSQRPSRRTSSSIARCSANIARTAASGYPGRCVA